MKIYYVTRWGNDLTGPDEEDTSFIVSAKSHSSAAEIVDKKLAARESQIVSNFCHRITQLGETLASCEKIIVGPTVQNALYHDDIGIPDKDKWVRDNMKDGWETYTAYYAD